MDQRVVTVFGGSSPVEGDREYALARELGRLLAEAGFAVCNGGYAGTMEASARGAMEAGGHTIGVVADIFPGCTPNPWLGEIVSTPNLLSRLMALIERGDAYVVLGGSTGTLLEFAAVWELMNKALLTARPVVTLGGYWQEIAAPVAAQLRQEGREAAASLVRHTGTPAECVQAIRASLARA
jgi:uncharacterized protein (TIGR00730 family)